MKIKERKNLPKKRKNIEDPLLYLSALKDIKDESDFDPSRSAHKNIAAKNFVTKEVDIASMVRSAIDDNSLVPKDVKIDDGDMPLAKNFYEWVTKDSFSGTIMSPFMEQLIWGTVLFGEACYRCSDVNWLLDTHKVNDTFATFEKKVSLLEHGKCSSCGALKSDMVRAKEMPFFHELAVQAGQRSGKSAAVGGMLAPYITHRVLKMQKPNDVYGIAGSTMLHGTFVALTYAQAKETLWEFFYGTLCESEWFKNYHALLRHYEERYGQQLLKFNDTFVVYRPRSLMVYPAGPDKRVLRGRTRIFACIPGDTLISTNLGLVRMDKIELGTRVNIGNINAPIIQHKHTGKKQIWKLRLTTGQELKASANHKVLCYRNGNISKVEIFRLRPTDQVMYALGGEFTERSHEKIEDCIARNCSKESLIEYLKKNFSGSAAIKSAEEASILQQLLFRLNINCCITFCDFESMYHVHVDPDYANDFFALFGTSVVKTKSLYFGESTAFENMRCSGIAYVEKTDEVVDVYDMTVDHEIHAYAANGILVSNSVDEVGWFDNAADSQKIKTSAREVYTALDRSLLTVRGSAERLVHSGFSDILTGFFMNVSSPSSQRDKICELVRQSYDSDFIYGIHRPTWEVNPSLPRNSTVIVSEYQKNPLDAERDYGANPPLSANPYITNKEWLENALGTHPNKIKLRDRIKNRKQQGQATKWAEIDRVGKCKSPTMLAIDAGFSSNSFACAVGRNVGGKAKINLLFEIIPEPGIPLNYTKIYDEALEEVLMLQNTQVVLADRWNSIKILQDIEERLDICVDQYSLKYKDIGITKSYFESGNIVLPKMDSSFSIDDCLHMVSSEYPMSMKNRPVEHLILQILTVQDTGTQVTKGDGLTDDLWRALCLLVWGLTNEKYEEYMNLPDSEEEIFRPQAFAVSRLGSGGGRSVGSGSGNTSFGGAVGVMRKLR